VSALERDDPEPPVCGHWIGAERRYCRAIEMVRQYLPGLRCPLHTPAALAGKPEPDAGPDIPAGAWTTSFPQSASVVFGEAAVRSGERRAVPDVYRAADRPQRE